MALESSSNPALPAATYNWQTTVCAGCSPPETATLTFAGYMTLTITNSNGGSINLYDLNMSFADDDHYVGVCCPP